MHCNNLQVLLLVQRVQSTQAWVKLKLAAKNITEVRVNKSSDGENSLSNYFTNDLFTARLQLTRLIWNCSTAEECLLEQLC